jgi:hypothetical protein
MDPAEKLQAELAHALRVIERMESREKWFIERIEQLEVFGKKVAGELAEVRSSCQEVPGSPKLMLKLGDLSLPDHERLAKNMRASILKEDGIDAGMTPVAPLLPIPSHSLQKTVSWGDLYGVQGDGASELHKACIMRGGGAGTHDDCPYCLNGQRR